MRLYDGIAGNARAGTRRRLDLAGRTVLITGAGGGIGRGLALAFARRGCHLALVDIHSAGLAATVALVADLGSDERVSRRVSRHLADMGDADAIAALPALVGAHHPGVDVLVNNAGVALAGGFEELAPDDMEWLFAINFWGPLRMTRAFLPLLRASGQGWLVNVSSVFGLVAPPGETLYAASKFALRGLTQALRHELRHQGVGVTLVYPGGVASGMVANARQPRDASGRRRSPRPSRFGVLTQLDPEDAGERIARLVEQRHPRALVGSDARLASWFERVLPVSYWRLITLLMRLRVR